MLKILGTVKKFILDSRINTINTKSILLYLVFVVISFLFWLFLTLNNTVQKDIAVHVEITSLPDSTTIVTDLPEYINVSVKDKAGALLKYLIGEKPTIKIKFADYADGAGQIRVSEADFMRMVRNLFESTTTISGISMNSITLKYTDLPGKLVPVRLDLDIQPNIQYVIYGPIGQDVDSVRIYSDRNTLSSIDEVYTYHVEERELTDTLEREVTISPIPGVKIVPRKLRLTIPVEPLIAKKQMVPIRVKNVPMGINVITFPSVVEASFLVPFSTYRKFSPIVATADYRELLVDSNHKLGIRIEESPALYKNLSLAIDSVEYIIEKR